MSSLLSDRIYKRKSKSPVWWYDKSSDLRASAGTIWIGMEDAQSDKIVKQLKLGSNFSLIGACLPIYYMLCGLSLELIFKAIIISKYGKAKEIHFLNELAERACVEYDIRKKGILKILTESIIWDGKYPVPKNKKKLMNYINFTIFVSLTMK